MTDSNYPPCWDEERVLRVIEYYESLSEEKMVAEDESALDCALSTVMEAPVELVPRIRALIAKRRAASGTLAGLQL